MKKKILILGATGMAGHMIYYYLLKNDKYHLSTLVFQSILNKDSIVCDIRNPIQLSYAIKKINPDIIVNGIGELVQKSNIDPDNAILLNSWLPHYLVKQCRLNKSKLIHISSDCVFSGRTGSYSESDRSDAEDIYGRTKALGEIQNNIDVTLRTSIIGPELKSNGKGLFHWYMNQKGTIEGYNNSYWSGITTYQLAKSIDDAIEHNLSGLYHVTNGIPISKYKLLLLINKSFSSKVEAIIPNNKIINNKSLQHSIKYNFNIPEYDIMINDLKCWFNNNQELYRLYY